MTIERRDAATLLVVRLEREDEEVSTIAEILEPLGIPVEIVGRGRQLRRAPSVVLRVPHHRVPEAILALELRGYAEVLAYEIQTE